MNGWVKNIFFLKIIILDSKAIIIDWKPILYQPLKNRFKPINFTKNFKKNKNLIILIKMLRKNLKFY